MLRWNHTARHLGPIDVFDWPMHAGVYFVFYTFPFHHFIHAWGPSCLEQTFEHAGWVYSPMHARTYIGYFLVWQYEHRWFISNDRFWPRHSVAYFLPFHVFIALLTQISHAVHLIWLTPYIRSLVSLFKFKFTFRQIDVYMHSFRSLTLRG